MSCASYFHRPSKLQLQFAAADPWQPKTKTAPKTYVRKPAYEYGWDWGPTFVTSGIWRPVRLEAWDKVRIADFAIRQRDVSREVAHVDAEVQIEAAHAGPRECDGALHRRNQSRHAASKAFDLHAGLNTVTRANRNSPAETLVAGRLRRSAALRIYGERKRRGRKRSRTSDEREVKTGLRSIVLDRHPDNGAAPSNSSSTASPSSPRAPTSFPSTAFPIASPPPTTAAFSSPPATPT